MIAAGYHAQRFGDRSAEASKRGWSWTGQLAE